MVKKAGSGGFAPEEKRLRKRLIELGLMQKDVAHSLGISTQDVSMVIRGRSKSPSYVAEVYKFLGMEMPDKLA